MSMEDPRDNGCSYTPEQDTGDTGVAPCNCSACVNDRSYESELDKAYWRLLQELINCISNLEILVTALKARIEMSHPISAVSIDHLKCIGVDNNCQCHECYYKRASTTLRPIFTMPKDYSGDDTNCNCGFCNRG